MPFSPGAWFSWARGLEPPLWNLEFIFKMPASLLGLGDPGHVSTLVESGLGASGLWLPGNRETVCGKALEPGPEKLPYMLPVTVPGPPMCHFRAEDVGKGSHPPPETLLPRVSPELPEHSPCSAVPCGELTQIPCV